MNKALRSMLLLATAAPLLNGCAHNETHSTVLGPDQTEIVGEQCSRPNPPHHESVWQPGLAEVQHLEQDLPQLDALAPGSGLGDPKAYARQYFGILAQGRRLIYVNGFLEPMANKEWQQYAIVVCGGGTGAWGAVYDPASRRFSDFSFNGAR